jgi:diaminopimelate epimerase
MTSSRWHAHGNVYLVAEDDEYTMDPELDGVLRVLDVDGDDVHVAIVNPDGSLAEVSGNGTSARASWRCVV